MRPDGKLPSPTGVATQLRLATLVVLLIVGIFVLGILSLLSAYGAPSASYVEIQIAVGAGALVAMVAIAFGALILARTLAVENWDLDRRVSLKTAELLIANEKLSTTVAQLEEATRLKEDLLANVSHELRTPLTLIKVAAATLGRSDGELPPAKRAQMLSRIDTGIERLIRMVEDLLAFSRMEAGRLKLGLEEGDFGAHVDQTVHALAPIAGPKGVSLETGIASDLPPAWFDKARAAQILINLVENAIKFTPAGGSVTVRVGRDGDFAVLSVADTGEGIPPEHLPHIFERFYQVDRTMRRQHGGTGLGLAVVKSLVELHGGSVRVESQVGTGTTFWVRLPLKAPALDETEFVVMAGPVGGEGEKRD